MTIFKAHALTRPRAYSSHDYCQTKNGSTCREEIIGQWLNGKNPPLETVTRKITTFTGCMEKSFAILAQLLNWVLLREIPCRVLKGGWNQGLLIVSDLIVWTVGGKKRYSIRILIPQSLIVFESRRKVSNSGKNSLPQSKNSHGLVIS